MPTPESFVWATALTKKETTFGGGFATDPVYADWVAGNGADFVAVNKIYVDNDEEINGSVGAPTEHILQLQEGSLSRTFFCSTEVLTAFLAWALGNVNTTGSSDPWTHTITWPLPCSVNPPSFSFIELLNCAGFTATYFKYKGCTVDSVTVEMTDKGYIKLTVAIKTDGTETADASFTVPSSPTVVKRLLGNMVTVKYGPVGTETQTGVRSVKFTISLGLIVPPDISANTTVQEFQYKKGGPTLDNVEIVLKGDKSHTVYGYHTAGTVCKLDLLIDPGVSPARSVELIASQTKVTCEVKANGPENQLTMKLLLEANSTDGSAANPRPAKFICKNGNSAYLTAA